MRLSGSFKYSQCSKHTHIHTDIKFAQKALRFSDFLYLWQKQPQNDMPWYWFYQIVVAGAAVLVASYICKAHKKILNNENKRLKVHLNLIC